MFAIVNRYRAGDELAVRAVYGPFETRAAADVSNVASFPIPELNVIVPLYPAPEKEGDR
jgi:hypothetical protein